MSTEEIAPTVDHRRPQLVSIAVRTVAAAGHAASSSGRSLSDVVSLAAAELFAREHGEHRETVLGAISRGTGVAFKDLAAIYDSHEPAKDVRTLKQLAEVNEDPSYDLAELTDAVVRFEACHHVNLVKKFVTQFVSRQDPGTLNRSAEELFSYGYIGLSNALRGYDPTSCTLSTFANFRVVGAVRDGVRSESPVPKRLTTFVRAVETAEEKLTRALSRVPTESEVREALGDQAKYMHLYPRLRRQASIEELVGYNPVSDDDVARAVEQSEAGAAVQEELAELTEVERQAVQLIHGEGLSARKASKECGIPAGELGRAADAALVKLRQSPRLQQWATRIAA